MDCRDLIFGMDYIFKELQKVNLILILNFYLCSGNIFELTENNINHNPGNP